jgi:hypothetical protein
MSIQDMAKLLPGISYNQIFFIFYLSLFDLAIWDALYLY